ncbi:hypothetical protein, partial [Sphingomonas bacterium]|uniref:hypothetical protein n=1 Tax=Sphingomonas bacterium TaxID=1895847 RepID=UPI001C2D9E2D
MPVRLDLPTCAAPTRLKQLDGDRPSGRCRSSQTRRRPRPPGAAVMAEVAGDFGIGEEAAGAQMRAVDRTLVDQAPERLCVGRSVQPAGEEGAGVGEGQAGGQVDPDQPVLVRPRDEPGEQRLARPAAIEQDGRGVPRLGDRDRQP